MPVFAHDHTILKACLRKTWCPNHMTIALRIIEFYIQFL
jgi:hypothetical protein